MHITFVSTGVLNYQAVKDQILQQLGSCGATLSSRVGCLPGTRDSEIRSIFNWAVQPSSNEKGNVFWLYGMAGTGKSAIAATVATRFSEIKRLGAFLCLDRESTGKNSPSTVVKALAGQLALFDGRLGALIMKAVNEDIRILEASPLKQFDKLITKPIASISNLHGEGPIVVVLDGLDQCGQPSDCENLLDIFAHQMNAFPPNLRFIFTSCRVRHVQKAFAASDICIKSQDISLSHLSVHWDISAYIRFRMQQVRDKNEDLSADWPGLASIAELAIRARGFFSWAVAASDYIDAHNPPECLKSLLLDDGRISEINSSLDNIYTSALASSGEWKDDDFVADFRATLSTIIASPIPLLTTAIEKSTSHSLKRPLTTTIRRLGALLTIQEPVAQLLHPSFVKFLTSRRRCRRGEWYIESEQNYDNTFPAARCLRAMCSGLKRNLCNATILTLPDVKLLSKDLVCACQAWVSHVCAVGAHQTCVILMINLFFRKHILHWIEAMGVLKKTDEIVPMLEKVSAWLPVAVRVVSFN